LFNIAVFSKYLKIIVQNESWLSVYAQTDQK
jgi:hypothetical protein